TGLRLPFLPSIQFPGCPVVGRVTVLGRRPSVVAASCPLARSVVAASWQLAATAREASLVPKLLFGNVCWRNSVSYRPQTLGAEQSFAEVRSQTGVWEGGKRGKSVPRRRARGESPR